MTFVSIVVSTGKNPKETIICLSGGNGFAEKVEISRIGYFNMGEVTNFHIMLGCIDQYFVIDVGRVKFCAPDKMASLFAVDDTAKNLAYLFLVELPRDL